MPNIHIILAFDFGMRKIGVAVGQSLNRSAKPIAIIHAKDGIPNWDDIQNHISEWEPTLLLVGLPLNMDGTNQHITHCAKKFGNRLREKFKLPVEMIDERLTTIAARERVHEARWQKTRANDDIDDFSATILIEDWFAQHDN